MSIFKNFINALRRYKIAAALNIFGLSIALAAAMLISIQVKYDLTFDRSYAKADQLFRLETSMMSEQDNQYLNFISRPIGEKIIALSPNIQAGGCIMDFGQEGDYYRENDPSNYTRVNQILVSMPIIDMFDFRAVQGDLHRMAEPNTAIISQSTAHKIFGTTSPIDQTMMTKNDTLTIVGVYADFPENSSMKNDVVIRDIGKDYLENEGEWSFSYFLQLNNPRIKTDIQRLIFEEIKKIADRPEEVKLTGFRLTAVPDMYFANDLKYDNVPKGNKSTTYILLAIAILVIVIAMVNFINFFMALVPTRIRSINISKVFGAPNTVLRLNIITEAIGITLISSGVALFLTYVVSLTPLAGFINGSIALDQNMWVVYGTLGVAAIIGFGAGLYPAFYITKFQAALVLKGSFGRSKAGQRLRMVLVGVQFVISIAMIICALFVTLQTDYMQRHNMGFDRENILTTQVSNAIAKQKTALINKLQENPAIMDVAFADGPLVANGKMGWGRNYKGTQISYDCFPVSWNFLQFMKIKTVDGRDFIEEDELKTNGTYIFNEVAAKQFDIKVGETMSGHTEQEADIVGIAKNFNFKPMQYGITPIALYIMGSNGWREQRYTYFRIAAGSDLKGVMNHIEKTIREVDPSMTEVSITPFDEVLAKLYQKESRLSALIGLFSLLAIIISLVGVFGLVVFEAQYRRKEIGVRKVHGSTTGAVLAMFNRRFLYINLVSFCVAAPLAYVGIARWLEGFSYRTPIVWWVFPVALLIVTLITAATVTFQTYKAANENPINSLKSE